MGLAPFQSVCGFYKTRDTSCKDVWKSLCLHAAAMTHKQVSPYKCSGFCSLECACCGHAFCVASNCKLLQASLHIEVLPDLRVNRAPWTSASSASEVKLKK